MEGSFRILAARSGSPTGADLQRQFGGLGRDSGAAGQWGVVPPRVLVQVPQTRQTEVDLVQAGDASGPTGVEVFP